MDKEDEDMLTLKERLVEANKKVDLKIDDIWTKAENNLKQLEADYRKNTEGRKKD